MPVRTAVKRSAPSSKSHGSPTKKVVVSKSKAVGQNKSNLDYDGRKRRLPITVPADAHDDLESEDEGNEGDFAADEGVDLGGENNPEMKTSLLGKNPNGVFLAHSNNANIPLTSSFPASRESHKAQREVTRQRQAAKPHADVLSLAKRQWSLARQKNISHAERQKHVKVLMDAVRGKIQDVVFKHDASRVVQTVSSREMSDVPIFIVNSTYRSLNAAPHKCGMK
jgi:pumilio homology domain family member 6